MPKIEKKRMGQVILGWLTVLLLMAGQLLAPASASAQCEQFELTAFSPVHEVQMDSSRPNKKLFCQNNMDSFVDVDVTDCDKLTIPHLAPQQRDSSGTTCNYEVEDTVQSYAELDDSGVMCVLCQG